MKNIWKRIKLWYYGPTIRMIEDFNKTFPGQCFICSYYRYGRRELGTNEETPPHEGCKEQLPAPPVLGGEVKL